MWWHTRRNQISSFVRNGRVHLNRRGHQFSRLPAAKVCSSAFIVGSNAGYTMFRGSVKGTGYPLHSPVSPSLPLPCVTVCHHVSTGVYSIRNLLLSPLGHLEFFCALHIFEKFLHPFLVPQVPVLMHTRRGDVIHNLYLYCRAAFWEDDSRSSI